MADNQHPQQPAPDPFHGSEPIAVSETELDSVLEKAASQLHDLAHEIGTAAPPPAKDHGTPLDESESVTPEVDRRLNEIDGLLQTAGHELGAVAAAKPASPANSVPDFMREFSDPDPTKPSAATKSEVRQATPASVPDFMAELTGPDASSAPRQTPNRAQAPQPVKSSQTTIAKHAPPSNSRATGASSSRATGSGLLSTAGEIGLRGLEQIDRYSGQLGPTPKRLLGWLAIAMLAAAVIVFLINSR